MIKITHLQDYKNLKKIQKIVSDLEKVEVLLTNNIKTISAYKRYMPARSVLMNLMENKALVMVHLKKCRAMLERYNENKLEKVSERNPS